MPSAPRKISPLTPNIHGAGSTKPPVPSRTIRSVPGPMSTDPFTNCPTTVLQQPLRLLPALYRPETDASVNCSSPAAPATKRFVVVDGVAPWQLTVPAASESTTKGPDQPPLSKEACSPDARATVSGPVPGAKLRGPPPVAAAGSGGRPSRASTVSAATRPIRRRNTASPVHACAMGHHLHLGQ